MKAYHVCCSVQLNNVSKSDLEDKISGGRAAVSLTPLWEKERTPPPRRRWEKMIFELTSRQHPFTVPH